LGFLEVPDPEIGFRPLSIHKSLVFGVVTLDKILKKKKGREGIHKGGYLGSIWRSASLALSLSSIGHSDRLSINDAYPRINSAWTIQDKGRMPPGY
jgi:hypothetical protein